MTEEEITDKDKLISMLRNQIDMLQEIVRELNSELDVISTYSLPELPSFVFNKV